MRVAAKYGRLVVSCQRDIVEHFATGVSRVVQRSLDAQFTPGGLQPFERELALAKWEFKGLYQEADEATHVQPDYRIGVFDSVEAQLNNLWTDEERLLVEAVLSDPSRSADVLVLPRTTLTPPWPRYDDFNGTVRQLIKKLMEDGHDLEQVLAYEEASQNREPVLDALRAQLAGVEPEPEEEVVS